MPPVCKFVYACVFETPLSGLIPVGKSKHSVFLMYATRAFSMLFLTGTNYFVLCIYKKK